MIAADLTGKTIGGYQVLRKLGQGGMATVYQAHEQSLNREVALKVIAPHLAEQEEFVARFQREAQAAARLSHPNIVPIYSIGQDAGVHYYAMEYVRGRTLSEVVAEEGPIPPHRAVPIFRQAAEALAVAHDAGIVHRDIKPANIMLDQTGRVRVTDFGIAQIASEKGMTRTGALIGTPEFMSPEQCVGEKPDARSDIYSLGVTFFQVLAGKTPFTAETPGHLLLQIVHGERVPIENLNPDLPGELRDLLTRMMMADREHRVQTARDVVDALDAMSGVAGARAAVAPTARLTVPVAAEAATIAGAAVAQRRSSAGKPLAIAAALVLLLLLATLVPWAMTRSADPVPPPGPVAAGVVPALPAESPDSTAPETTTAASAAPATASATTDGPVAAGASEPVGAAQAPTGQAAVSTPASGAAAEPAATQDRRTDPGPATATPPAATASRDPAAAPAVETAAPEPAPLPPLDTVVVDVAGEYEYVDLVGAWIEQELATRGFRVVAMPAAGSIADVARTQLIVTAKLVGARELQFMGRIEMQYTVGLVLRGVDTISGAVLAGPVAETVEYTARNMQVQLERETRRITVNFATSLRQAQR